MKKLTLITIMLGILVVANAQTDENIILEKDFFQKNELKLTPEITKKLIKITYSSFIDKPERHLSNFGIKNISQLDNLELGKPVPKYVLDNGSVRFTNRWTIPVLSDGEPLHFVNIKLESDGQYEYVGCGGATFAELFHNFEQKDLIIGKLEDDLGLDYYIIRKDNTDIYIEVYDYNKREYLKSEYSLQDIINRIKE